VATFEHLGRRVVMSALRDEPHRALKPSPADQSSPEISACADGAALPAPDAGSYEAVPAPMAL
jgi:hypothetical protein